MGRRIINIVIKGYKMSRDQGTKKKRKNLKPKDTVEIRLHQNLGIF